MRDACAPEIDLAIERASTVFAVPGTSSSSTWPRQMRAQSTSLISSRLPRTTCSMFSSSRWARAAASISSGLGSTCFLTISSFSAAPSARLDAG